MMVWASGFGSWPLECFNTYTIAARFQIGEMILSLQHKSNVSFDQKVDMKFNVMDHVLYLKEVSQALSWMEANS